MKKILGMSLVLLIVVTGSFFTLSCAKKTIQTDPSLESEQAMEEEGEADAETDVLDEQALEEQRLEEERLAAEQEQLKKEQEAIAAKEKFENEDIFFDFDSSIVLSAAQMMLQEKASWLEDNSDIKVIIEGHCDERGTEAYNLALGERRAEAVKNYLIDLGINPKRLTSISFGEERPVDPAQNESAWAKNRRVHFAIE
ncbi:MAG: peptidoglycan-associated lipoprotein Pal [Desulfobacteraceae bacterium]|jgi:peptidoglycan-associated lipoprotein